MDTLCAFLTIIISCGIVSVVVFTVRYIFLEEPVRTSEIKPVLKAVVEEKKEDPGLIKHHIYLYPGVFITMLADVGALKKGENYQCLAIGTYDIKFVGVAQHTSKFDIAGKIMYFEPPLALEQQS